MFLESELTGHHNHRTVEVITTNAGLATISSQKYSRLGFCLCKGFRIQPKNNKEENQIPSIPHFEMLKSMFS